MPAKRREAGSTRDLVDELEGRLRRLGRPERAEGAKRYLKSDLDFIGVGNVVRSETLRRRPP